MRSSPPPAVLPLFRSDAQARIIARLFAEPDRQFTLAELGDGSGRRHRSTLQRELSRLVGAGMVERGSIGRTAVYRAETDSPLYEPLRQLIERTVGAEATLRDGLRALPGVDAAAIVGSWARGDLRAGSDIDVLVVGSVSPEHLVDVARSTEERSGREVHWLLYAVDEARDHLRSGGGFFRQALDDPSVPLVGDLARVLEGDGTR